jgi:hypothetical protein
LCFSKSLPFLGVVIVMPSNEVEYCAKAKNEQYVAKSLKIFSNSVLLKYIYCIIHIYIFAFFSPEHWFICCIILDRQCCCEDTARRCTSHHVEQVLHMNLLFILKNLRQSIILTFGITVCIILHIIDALRWNDTSNSSTVD